ncbi:MAG: hypothetical protein HC901_04050, partial [Bdellovibrionaceae bacterium]|nr:hypothetical protein [Pseudobdellovibrionaceae bacterium]
KAEDAIALQPGNIAGMDLKAQTLVRLRRIDEGAAVFERSPSHIPTNRTW